MDFTSSDFNFRSAAVNFRAFSDPQSELDQGLCNLRQIPSCPQSYAEERKLKRVFSLSTVSGERVHYQKIRNGGPHSMLELPVSLTSTSVLKEEDSLTYKVNCQQPVVPMHRAHSAGVSKELQNEIAMKFKDIPCQGSKDCPLRLQTKNALCKRVSAQFTHSCATCCKHVAI